MDQLSAHLDRGWDLAQKGDVRGAAESARSALEIDPSCPEGYNLLGYVSTLDGECEDAVDAYQQAFLLDESYVEAMLNAAELLVHPMGQYDEAIALCAQILDLSTYPDEVVDAKLLQIEAAIAKKAPALALKILGSLPAGPFDDSSHNYLAGRAHFELGSKDEARTFFDAAIEDPHCQPEALYFRALLFEKDGLTREANTLFLRVRESLLVNGPPPWSPNPEALLMFTEQAIAKLQSPGAELLDEASLYIVDLPGPEAIVDGVDVQAHAMIEAAPDGPNGRGGFRIYLYMLNILRQTSGLEDVQSAIQNALEGELNQLVKELESLSMPSPDAEEA